MSRRRGASGDTLLRPRIAEFLRSPAATAASPGQRLPESAPSSSLIEACVAHLVGRHPDVARKPRGVLKNAVARELSLQLPQFQSQQQSAADQVSQTALQSAPFRHRHPSAAAASGSDGESSPQNHNILNASLRQHYDKNAAVSDHHGDDGGDSAAAVAASPAMNPRKRSDVSGELRDDSRSGNKTARVPKRRKTRARESNDEDKLTRMGSHLSGFPEGAVDGYGGETLFAPVPLPVFGYESLGGIGSVLENLRDVVETPMLHPELFEELGCRPSVGVLLHGPSGCGKTHLASAIAGELGKKMKSWDSAASTTDGDTEMQSVVTDDQPSNNTASSAEAFGPEVEPENFGDDRVPLEGVPRPSQELSFFKVSAPELVSGVSGESESNIRRLFASAIEHQPALVFIDEIDTICQKRSGSGKAMEERIVASFLTSFDDLGAPPPTLPAVLRSGPDEEGLDKVLESNPVKFHRVMVIAATNRLDAIDPALRRTGRFDREIPLCVPDIKARSEILRVHAANLKLRATNDTAEASIDFLALAKMTPGFVGADCQALTKEAASIVIRNTLLGGNQEVFRSRTFPRVALDSLFISQVDFEAATKVVQPSAKREGFATIPDVSWEDVGALDDIRSELRMAVLEPIKFPERFIDAGLDMPTGVLLYGPPGCGKTLLAKAIASDCNAGFISVKGPELLNKYVGESEAAVRRVFERARLSKPCIIFFDELDALCPRRDDGDGNSATKRVVNQLLTEMDGFGSDERRGIFIVAATNRPDIIDPAMLRPQRLDKRLFVPLPDEESRFRILETCARKHKLAADVQLRAIAAQTSHYSGADLAAVMREAVLISLDETMKAEVVGQKSSAEILAHARHFATALQKIPPSVSAEDEARYRMLGDEFSGGGSRNRRS